MSTTGVPTLDVRGPGAEKLIQAACGEQCTRDTPKVDPAELPGYMLSLPAWHVNDEKTMLTRRFTAKNFMAAIRFFNQVAEVAEQQGHHPDLHLRNFREVEVNVYTHAVGGITLPDLALAALLDGIEVDYSPKWAKAEAERLTGLTAADKARQSEKAAATA
ncbi:hypothetical protein HYH03_012891 [Edaphochlamys debaryana]|uniref:4a-hydroxytetrahydrobiopterin dehydratase n=1 Tax=Edaphochlamys debaryana TaxID=47281 RepID=A0A835XS05_9CHLO|nr:hypothetical protein HYH03_012891 [Edaphochlamys debaryana]|eukprot:KAG2488572.1 hypothetical protein HYH03_012891 [Edaphochlamys debaryana]